MPSIRTHTLRSAKSEAWASPDFDCQNQYFSTAAQSDPHQQPAEMTDREDRNDFILKWIAFLLFLTVPLFIVVVSFLPRSILCTNPKLITYASSGTVSWVQATLQMMLDQKWQDDLLIAAMNMRARRTKYCFMIIMGTLWGGTANLLWPRCMAKGS